MCEHFFNNIFKNKVITACTAACRLQHSFRLSMLHSKRQAAKICPAAQSKVQRPEASHRKPACRPPALTFAKYVALKGAYIFRPQKKERTVLPVCLEHRPKLLLTAFRFICVNPNSLKTVVPSCTAVPDETAGEALPHTGLQAAQLHHRAGLF